MATTRHSSYGSISHRFNQLILLELALLVSLCIGISVFDPRSMWAMAVFVLCGTIGGFWAVRFIALYFGAHMGAHKSRAIYHGAIALWLVFAAIIGWQLLEYHLATLMLIGCGAIILGDLCIMLDHRRSEYIASKSGFIEGLLKDARTIFAW